MQNISFPKQIYYACLGRAFAFAYHTNRRRFSGYSLSSWFKFLIWTLLLAAFVQRWSAATLLLLLLLAMVTQIFYWRAGKLGYHRFVAGDTAVSPIEAPPLARNRRIPLYASGLYAVADRAQQLLLRPAEYWVSARGEHGVMVRHDDGKYLYQFFRSETLQKVQVGWLLFGKAPLPTVAITFRQTWGPEYTDNITTYMVGGGEKENGKGKSVTIYFTFTDTAVQNQVWRSLTMV